MTQLPQFRPVFVPLAVLATILAAGFGTACADDYEPRLICHNANCVEPTNPELDDTIEALQSSLALEDESRRPYIDGIEIDTFWYGDEARCLFAHDLATPDRAIDAQEAVDRINEHLRARYEEGLPLTRTAPLFSVFIELKGHVGIAKDEKHSPQQRQAHVECAISLGESLEENARETGFTLDLVYTSFDPDLLLGLRRHERFAAIDTGNTVHQKLGILQGIPRPLDSQTLPLDQFPDEISAEVISVHPHWTRDTDLNIYDSRGFELGYWMFDVVPETLSQIRRHRPVYITTSEARLLASWLD